jgi:hypothetical protein
LLVHGAPADHIRWHDLLPHAAVHAKDRSGRGGSGDAADYAVQHELLDKDEPCVVRAHPPGRNASPPFMPSEIYACSSPQAAFDPEEAANFTEENCPARWPKQFEAFQGRYGNDCYAHRTLASRFRRAQHLADD